MLSKIIASYFPFPTCGKGFCLVQFFHFIKVWSSSVCTPWGLYLVWKTDTLACKPEHYLTAIHTSTTDPASISNSVTEHCATPLSLRISPSFVLQILYPSVQRQQQKMHVIFQEARKKKLTEAVGKNLAVRSWQAWEAIVLFRFLLLF